MILDKLVDAKLKRLKILKEQCSTEEMISRYHNTESFDKLDFKAAIKRSDDINIISEIKKASPSKGIISVDFDVAAIAENYRKADVQAISVLTEEDYFLGNIKYLQLAKKIAGKPVLRKDFTIDKWQIYESAIVGADAILLIVAILDDKKLKSFIKLADDLELSALVEVHDITELKRAMDADAQIIGINNRDLRTFNVDLNTSESMVRLIPNDIIKVSESGIKTPQDVQRMRDADVDALLVGESFMRSDDIPAMADWLRGK